MRTGKVEFYIGLSNIIGSLFAVLKVSTLIDPSIISKTPAIVLVNLVKNLFGTFPSQIVFSIKVLNNYNSVSSLLFKK